MSAYSRYEPVRARFFTAPAGLTGSAQSAIPAPAVGATRSMVRLWDVDAEGQIKAPPVNSWAAGTIIRSGQPIFVLTSLGPMFDPSDPHQANATRAEL